MVLEVILRDDDVSYFTNPDDLEEIYSKLFEKNIPVCFSVIPKHKGNIKKNGELEINVPPKYRGMDRTFSILENKKLCDYLKKKKKKKQIELCLHGLNHDYNKKAEFEVKDYEVAKEMLNESLNEFRKAFKFKPKIFVPPYDKISKEGKKAVFDFGLDLCTNANNYSILNRNKSFIREGESKIFLSKNYLPSFRIKTWKKRLLRYGKRKIKEKKKSTIIITSHYWQFFHEFEKPKVEMINEFQDTIKTLKDHGAEFKVFNGVN